jgi:hypothetical protein
MLIGLSSRCRSSVSGIPDSATGANLGWLLATGIGNVSGPVFATFAYRRQGGLITPILATEGALAAVIAALFGEHRPDRRLPARTDRPHRAGGHRPRSEPLEHERPVVAVLGHWRSRGLGISLSRLLI